MTLAAAFFYLFAALTVAAALMVISAKNPVHAVLFLIFAFFNAAGLFVLLGAEFLAMILVVVYVGAVAVLFLFVVMLLNAPQEDAAGWDRSHPFKQPGIARFGALLAVLLVVQLGWALARTAQSDTPTGELGGGTIVSSVRELGRVLFTDYMFAFEATSILILVAMVGAVALARREGDS